MLGLVAWEWGTQVCMGAQCALAARGVCMWDLSVRERERVHSPDAKMHAQLQACLSRREGRRRGASWSEG